MSQSSPGATPLRWAVVAESLARPYRVIPSMVVLVGLVPLYILIPAWFPPGVTHLPELAFDRAVPLVPAWSLVYGAGYLFLILLPVLVVRDEQLIRRTVHAYLFIWSVAYVFFFVVYPTEAPRPAKVVGEGFGVWGLRALYSADPPYNCFPSLHVAHSLLSALATRRVHRRLGAFATICAALVAASTLFTKQHYVIDVAAGVLLAIVAATLFLRRCSPDQVSEFDRRAAPALALSIGFVVALAVTGCWIAYLWTGETRFEFGP